MNTSPQLPPLEDAELVHEELFRHTPVGVVLSDLHGTIVDVNPALCAMVGYQRSELIGSKLYDISHPDDLADVLLRTSELREGKTGHYVVQRRYITRDGRVVHARVSVSLVYSKDGEAVCGIGFIQDITDRVRMEEELRHSEARYRRVVEDQTELIVRCLPDGTRTFVNEAYCRYNETTAGDLIGTSFFTCMGEEEQRIVRAKFDALTPEHPVITDQHWVRDPRGVMRWHEWTDRGFFDYTGHLIEIQSVGRDLTEEHEANERLVRSEERYRRMFNSLPIAAWENDWSDLMVELQRRGLDKGDALGTALRERPELFYELAPLIKIVSVNPAALQMAGVADANEFRQWLLKAWVPESATRYGISLQALLSGEKKFITGEYTLIRENGEPLDILYRVARSERWGEEWMIFPVAIDVTERKRIERQLEQKHELTERAEAAAHYGSWEWNPLDDMIYGSDEFWRILDGRDLGGPQVRAALECFQVMHPEDGERASTLWQSLQQPSGDSRPRFIERDYRIVRPDGTFVHAIGQTFPSYAPDGTMIRAFGIIRDITEEKRAEEESLRQRDALLRADKMISLGILVSGVAHEINNPNHSIGLNAPLVRNAWRDVADFLDERADTGDLRVLRMPWSEARGEVASMLEDVEHASDRIRNIVTELRGFALDQDPARRSNVSVNDIVNSSLRLLGKHIARATKHFGLSLADDVPPIAGNARRLEQVVVNLVINACQALESDEQSIALSTGVERDRVFIRVRDEGKGIAPEHLANIRTPFFTTKRAEGGTGLGVPVSDRIAEEHGGELTFESEPGHGTTATLWLPSIRT